ncbi:hypothetical protein COU17_01275 [Candidatus Kaiserbacteria bacterium CG10_big_fil_rev_8_21_14_0_10_49_17]|uniref:PpiC domain-containing protein n=1 Tax=Candidatus Kaiserbacteria bacterium CG10_big_fil_rev_8_21_14_0_10_49_17 TaxID=1974609 RepID=A0A2M6WEL4_9BACT|nr:MAG: hypothetical protein COU17_01275 [Candidatus Kaiserbacteria bacterium CG10_big_fil_rev_8_21_14_0_10_49_17]
MFKTKVLLPVIALIAIVAIGGAIYYFGGKTTEDGQVADNNSDTSAVVARVDGVAITRAHIDARIAQVKGSGQAQVPAEDAPEYAEFQEAVLTQLINEELFLKDAARLGIAPEDADVDAQLEQVKEQFESDAAFESQLAAVGLTNATLRADIERQLTLTAYYQQVQTDSEITVSEEDAQAVYDQVAANQELDVTFEDAKANIIAQLTQQKLNEALTQKAAELRANASVETLL